MSLASGSMKDRPATGARAVPGAALAHGGRLLEARRRFPKAPLPFIDLSTGINPRPYPLPDLAPALFTRLPEPEMIAALQAAAATAYGVRDPAMVVAAAGTQILIELLPRLHRLESVAILGPTYGEHAAAWARAGAAVRDITDLAEIEADFAPGSGRARGLVLCNPNNPDGRLSDPRRLAALAARLTAQGGLLVVDEAFADFAAADISLAPHLPLPGVIVLRSFGKAFGLAGLRLGFALAAPDQAAAIRAALGPWAVSGPAIEIGRRALLDRGWQVSAERRLAREAARLDARLGQAGLILRGGTSLFRLAEGDGAEGLFERLGRAGILVRRFAEQPRWLRFGLPPDEAAWARLDGALP